MSEPRRSRGWRGRGTSRPGLDPDDTIEPRPVNESLDRILRSLGAPPGGAFDRIQGRWADWVGADLVDHCELAALRDGALVVRVDQPGFVTSLRWSEAAIVAACEREIGPGIVDRLTIRVGPATAP